VRIAGNMTLDLRYLLTGIVAFPPCTIVFLTLCASTIKKLVEDPHPCLVRALLTTFLKCLLQNTHTVWTRFALLGEAGEARIVRYFGNSLGSIHHWQLLFSRYSTPRNTSYKSTVCSLVCLRIFFSKGLISSNASLLMSLD